MPPSLIWKLHYACGKLRLRAREAVIWELVQIGRAGQFSASGANFGNQPTAVRYFFAGVAAHIVYDFRISTRSGGKGFPECV